jgi:hypothetical protein
MKTDSKEWYSSDKHMKPYKTWTKAELCVERHKHMVLAMPHFVTAGGKDAISKGGVLPELKTRA